MANLPLQHQTKRLYLEAQPSVSPPIVRFFVLTIFFFLIESCLQSRILPWWTLLQRSLPVSIIPPLRDRRCPYCGALLLSSEANSFCCALGRQMMPSLQPLPPRMQQSLDNPPQRQHVIEHARANLLRSQLLGEHIISFVTPNTLNTPFIDFCTMKLPYKGKLSNSVCMAQLFI